MPRISNEEYWRLKQFEKEAEDQTQQVCSFRMEAETARIEAAASVREARERQNIAEAANHIMRRKITALMAALHIACEPQ